MKYSIDYHNGAISGWIETNDNDFFDVEITDSAGRIYTTIANLERPDVLKAMLSINIKCGFSFKGNLIDSPEGNFYQVNFRGKSFNKTVSIFCGATEKWQDSFEKFQVVDRNDFTIQNGSCIKLFSDNSDIIAFKLLMIRLRRGKRAFGWRGKFSGHAYSEMSNDWMFFKEFYTKNFLSLVKVLSVRSLWSVIDTFSDFGNELERTCALAVSNYMYQERFAQTLRRIYVFDKIHEPQLAGQTHYGGYMLTNQLKSDDAYDVFLTRNLEILEICPIIKKTFCHIFLETLKNELSINHINEANSVYFSEAFSYYKTLFKQILEIN